MDFVTAEEKFQELQARIRRGEPMSEDQYQEELAQLMVQDDTGVFWSLEPGTGRWLYFNGTEWVPGTPPIQAAAPAASPAPTSPQTAEAETYQATTPPTAEPYAPVPEDTAPPMEYSGTYTGAAYAMDSGMQSPGYESPEMGGLPPSMEPEEVPTYVRMPEPETTVPTGGVPPRPVREASPLAVPGGDRAWLPFAFGALVLLLCAVALFFGIRGLPPFGGTAANTEPTEVPTEVIELLPTATVELVPTSAPRPTQAPTEEPQPTAEPQPVKATTTEVLNIRQGPARTTPSLGKLQKGQEVTAVGRNGDGTWLQIERPDGAGIGWVSAEFITLSGDINTLPVVSGENPAPQPTETPTG